MSMDLASALLYIYIGGAISLFCESLVQWLHPEESNTKETLGEAIGAALQWPIMAIVAILEFLKEKVK
jgi:hypothetical protein